MGRAGTSSITFSSGGNTVMSDESIFGAPPGEGGGGPKAPGRWGALPWSGWKGTRRRGWERFARRQTCVPDGVSLFGDGDHYSIRFHLGFEEKRLDDMRLHSPEWIAFFGANGKSVNPLIFSIAVWLYSVRHLRWIVLYHELIERLLV